jgi:large subunit ribosomal protein L29
MKAADLREKSVDDLRDLQKTLARDVFQNRLKNFTNRLDDTSMMRKTKRDLARVVTLLREQEKGIVRGPAAAKAEAAAPSPAEAKPAKKKAAPKAEVKSAAAEAPAEKPAAKKKSAKAELKKSEAK